MTHKCGVYSFKSICKQYQIVSCGCARGLQGAYGAAGAVQANHSAVGQCHVTGAQQTTHIACLYVCDAIFVSSPERKLFLQFPYETVPNLKIKLCIQQSPFADEKKKTKHGKGGTLQKRGKRMFFISLFLQKKQRENELCIVSYKTCQ